MQPVSEINGVSLISVLGKLIVFFGVIGIIVLCYFIFKRYKLIKRSSIMLGFTCILFVAGTLILYLLKEQYNIYLWIGFATSSEIIFFFLLISLILLIITLTMMTLNVFKSHKLAVKIIATIVVIIVLLVFAFFGFLKSGYKYYTFNSDNQEHKLVVKEESFLLAGWGSVYEEVSPYIIKRIGGYSTDDGYRPFSNKHFFFVWKDGEVELHYDEGLGLPEYDVIKMKLNKNSTAN